MYTYKDEAGELLFSVVRFEAPEAERDALRAAGERTKTFRPVRLPCVEHGDDVTRGYFWSLGDVRRVLYRLPEWQRGWEAGARMFLVEGEKDVDAGYRQCSGAVFTTAPGGVAGLESLLRDHNGAAFFAGIDTLDVVLDSDTNGAGDRVRDLVDQHLREPGHVRHARYWRAAVATDGADLADHLSEGFSLDQLMPA